MINFRAIYNDDEPVGFMLLDDGAEDAKPGRPMVAPTEVRRYQPCCDKSN